MPKDWRRSPWYVDEWFVNEIPVHQQVCRCSQEQCIENVRDHKNRIQNNRQPKENRLINLKNLGWKRQSANLAKRRLLRIPHHDCQRDGCPGSADIYKRGKKSVGCRVWQRLSSGC